MSEDLTPRCERCRHWSWLEDSDYCGKCALLTEPTRPRDFCDSFLPHEVPEPPRE